MSTPKLLKIILWCFFGLRVNGHYLVETVHSLCGFWFLKHIVATGRQYCLVTVFSQDLGQIGRFGLNLPGIQMSPEMCFLLSLPLFASVGGAILVGCFPVCWHTSCVLVLITWNQPGLCVLNLCDLRGSPLFSTCKMGSLALAILKTSLKKKKKRWISK